MRLQTGQTPTEVPPPPADLPCACGASVPARWEHAWSGWARPHECEDCVAAWRAGQREGQIAQALEAAQLPPRGHGLSLERTLRQGDGGREPWDRFRDRLDAADLPTLGITRWNAGAAKALRAWRPELPGAQPEGLVVLAGPVGGGKSALAMAALSDAIRRDPGLDALFMPEPTMLEMLRLEASGAQKRGISRRLATVRALVLDELGSSERVTDWQRDAIEFVVGARYNYCLPTIITTNLALDGEGTTIAGIYGDRVVSRLIEFMGGMRAKLPGLQELIGVDWRTDAPHPTTTPKETTA